MDAAARRSQLSTRHLSEGFKLVLPRPLQRRLRDGDAVTNVSGVSLRVPSRHPARPASVVGVEGSGALDHLLLPYGELV